MVAEQEELPRAAVIFAVVSLLTDEVEIVKEAFSIPTGTVTDGGTEAALELLFNVKTVPPDGAGPFRVTVPVTELPAVVDVGVIESEATSSGKRTSCPAFVELPNFPVIVTVLILVTEEVLTVKVVVFWPASIVIEEGTEADVLLLETEMESPLAGAA